MWTSHLSPVMRLFEYIVESQSKPIVTNYSIWQIPNVGKDACEEGVSLKWHDRRFEVQEKSHNEG